MAIDLDAIRRKVAELNGTKKSSSVQMWKPGVGDFKVRALPWKNATPESPIMERWFYYLGNGPGILAPYQFNKPDPIHELKNKLYSTGSPSDRALAKKLHAKMRAYLPVVVRGEEDKGVQIWSFGKLVYKRLYDFMLDADLGDFLDPNVGFDLRVNISRSAGKEFNDTTVDCKGKPSKLNDDSAKMQALLNSVPDLNDMYRLKTYDEVENALNTWLNTGVGDSTEEVSRGKSGTDALDELANEVKAEATPVASEEKQAKKSKKSSDDVSAKKQSIDDAFNELM